MRGRQTGISAQTLYTFCRVLKPASSVPKPKKQRPATGNREGKRDGGLPAAQEEERQAEPLSHPHLGGCLHNRAVDHFTH